MGRSIVLHLLARTKFIDARARLFIVFPQIEVSHEPGQGAVGDVTAVFALEDLLNPDDITLGAAEDLPDDGG